MSGVALYADQPSTTVATGGTAALSPGASEQWTVGSSATFPPASVSVVPPTSFFVADTAATSEIIQVTAVSSTVWGVVRGADSTTPVTHATGFTVQQVVTASGLNNLYQFSNNASTAATTVGASVTNGTMASFTPKVTDVPAAGVCYSYNGYGVFSSGVLATLFTMATLWNGTTLASATKGVSGTVVAETARSFWLEGQVDCYGATTMVCGFNFVSSGSTGTEGGVQGASPAGVTVSGTGPLSLVVTTGALQTFTTTGFACHRIS